MSEFNAEWAGFRANHMLNAMRRLPIEAQAAEQARIVLALEHDYREDVRCEHTHRPGTAPCSGRVMYRLTWCAGEWLICAGGAGHEQRKLDSGRHVCSGCLKPTETCWRVTKWG